MLTAKTTHMTEKAIDPVRQKKDDDKFHSMFATLNRDVDEMKTSYKTLQTQITDLHAQNELARQGHAQLRADLLTARQSLDSISALVKGLQDAAHKPAAPDDHPEAPEVADANTPFLPARTDAAERPRQVDSSPQAEETSPARRLIREYQAIVNATPIPPTLKDCPLPTGQQLLIEAASATVVNDNLLHFSVATKEERLPRETSLMFLVMSDSANPKGIGGLLAATVNVAGYTGMSSRGFVQDLASPVRVNDATEPHVHQFNANLFGQSQINWSNLGFERYIAIQLCIDRRPASNVLWVKVP